MINVVDYNRCFITKNTKYVLLDKEGDIRGTSTDLIGICDLKKKLGWEQKRVCAG